MTVLVHELIVGADKADLDRVFAGIPYVKPLNFQDVAQPFPGYPADFDVWKGLSAPNARRRAEF